MTWDSADFATASFTAQDNGMSGGVNSTDAIYSYAIPPLNGYDANGNLLQVTDSVMGTWNYIYDNVIWYAVRSCARRLEPDHLAPHDLRRTCARLCHVNGSELKQIQFLLGRAPVLTTERYLGCTQNLEEPGNDRFGCLFSGCVDSR